MSNALIDRSPDLKKLRDEGYDIEIRHNHLLVKDVPYLNSRKEVRRGILVSALTLAGDVTAKPDTHVVYFIGEYPCHKDGSEIGQIKNQTGNEMRGGPDLVINHTFSAKPTEAFKDYHEKMVTYVAMLSGPAQTIEPGVTAITFPANETAEGESVFNYVDTASSRAGIDDLTKKLELGKIAIVGLGGTGSYILDLVAKTPVKEIHLFDGDKLFNHNAFRAPGAPSIEELRQKPPKVDYFKAIYSKMHRHIISHDIYMDAANLGQLQGMAFVFLSLEGKIKQLIIERLEEWNIPFIDVGMGVDLVDGALHGILRVTSSTTKKRDHVRGKNRIPFVNGAGDDDYSRNIQIADLNALNATLAVIKWKKLLGFYHDFEREHFSAYTTDTDSMVNEDQV